MVWGEMSFEDGRHLGYRNGTTLAILNLYVAMMTPITSFEEFQDGHHCGHLGYWNETILAILNLCVTVMPPIKFQLNSTYGLGGDVV